MLDFAYNNIACSSKVHIKNCNGKLLKITMTHDYQILMLKLFNIESKLQILLQEVIDWNLQLSFYKYLSWNIDIYRIGKIPDLFHTLCDVNSIF